MIRMMGVAFLFMIGLGWDDSLCWPMHVSMVRRDYTHILHRVSNNNININININIIIINNNNNTQQQHTTGVTVHKCFFAVAFSVTLAGDVRCSRSGGTGSARHRRERRLRAYLRYARMSVERALAECQHHSAQHSLVGDPRVALRT